MTKEEKLKKLKELKNTEVYKKFKKVGGTVKGGGFIDWNR